MFDSLKDIDYQKLVNYQELIESKFIESFIPNFFLNTVYFFALFIFLIFLHKILDHKFKNNEILDKKLIQKTIRPFYWMIISFFLFSIVKLASILMPESNLSAQNILQNLPKIKKVLMIIFLGFSGFYFIKYFQKNYILNWQNKFAKAKELGQEIRGIDIAKIDLISKISIIFLFSILLFAIIGALGINLAGLAAIGGASGLIVGFATKDLFANFFGLFSVYMDQPFKIGDIINISDKNIKGAVEEIGLRTTSIRTYDKTIIYVPNSIFNTSIIENISRLTFRVLRYDVKIKNDEEKTEKINETIEDLKKKIRNLDIVAKIDSNPRITVIHFNSQFLDISFIVNLVATDVFEFEKNSQIVIDLTYRNFKQMGLEVIPYIPEINIGKRNP